MANLDRSASAIWRRLYAGGVAAVVAAGLLVAAPTAAWGQSRIKDIVEFEGVRDNMLVGYGLVVGLNGTGDTLNNAPFTQQSLVGMLERLVIGEAEPFAEGQRPQSHVPGAGIAGGAAEIKEA